MGCDQFTDQRHHPRDDLVLAMVAVGKERVVGDINIMRIGPCADNFAQHREAAEAGIEQENRWRRWHAAILADLTRPFSRFDGPGAAVTRGRALLRRVRRFGMIQMALAVTERYQGASLRTRAEPLDRHAGIPGAAPRMIRNT